MSLARPETRYADADGIRIGYQCFGVGKRTQIGVPGFTQNIHVIWENAEAAACFERLGSMCRVIHFDKRGTGVSDRSIPPPSLDARVQDLVTVMRAEAVDRAIIAGWSEDTVRTAVPLARSVGLGHRSNLRAAVRPIDAATAGISALGGPL